jgi:hypothetical protein
VSLGTILLIVLILLLVGALPRNLSIRLVTFVTAWMLLVRVGES